MPWPFIHAMSKCDEDIIVIGSNDYQRFYISRLNQSGDTIWTRHYLNGSNPGYFNTITRSSDGNYVMAGMLGDLVNSYIGLFAFTPQGDYLWHRLYASSNEAIGEHIELCSDGGFAVGGSIGNWSGEQACFIKTDANGHISGPGIFENNATDKLKLYPNPASGLVYLETDPDYQSIEIFDPSGRSVFKRNLSGQKENVETLDLNGFLQGVYLVRVYSTGAVCTEKLVIFGRP